MKEHTPLRIYGTKKNSDQYISFEAEDSLRYDYDRYSKYIKRCEYLVREDDRYVAYIAKLKQGGLTKCAVMGNLPVDDPKIKIEMHHGPIFNLFDYCDIVLKACLNRGMKDITTMKIADLVLTEHEKDHIMIVMLSKSVHMGGAHNRKSKRNVFIDITATFGRVDKFLDKWYDGLEEEHFGYIQRYCKECRNAQGKTLDQGLFDVADKLASFK